MKSPKRIIIGIVIVAIVTIAAAGVYKRVSAAKAASADSSGDSAKSNLPDVASVKSEFDPNEAVPVEGAPVQHGDLVLTVNAAGQAASRRPTILRAQVSGQVKSVAIRENSTAAAGQVLVTIDPTEYQLALADAKANLRNAEASFREMTLGDENIKDAAVRKERSDAARDKAHVESGEVAVMKAQLNLDRTNVKAPFGGRIANLKIVPGQFVNAGDELVTVQEMNPIRVDVQVLEGQIGSISAGREAEVTFAAFPGVKFQGRVETVNPIVDQVTRTARVSVAVPNPQGRILPGMYARVTLAGERLHDRTFVPRDAVLERDHGRTLVFVFVADSAGSDVGRAKWRYVTVGQDNGVYKEMVPDDNEGVKEGDIVLVAGHSSLSHDGRVRLTKRSLVDGGRPE
jgi:HlyD family secretion protein